MASKKLKKALAIGIGAGLGAKFLAGKARAGKCEGRQGGGNANEGAGRG